LSPDGRSLVYTVKNMLYLRRMDEIEGKPIAGTEGGANNPVFSPDSQWIAYESGNQLSKIGVSGGIVTKICDIGGGRALLSGLAWNGDRLIFSYYDQTTGERRGIFEVASNGGTPRGLISLAAGEAAQNAILMADGDTLLFTLRSTGSNSIVAQSIKT